MTSFLTGLYDFFLDGDETLANLPAILDHQAAEQSLGGVRFSNEWLQQRAKLDSLLEEKTDESLSRALKIFAKVIDTLDLYAPALKGLTDVHGYVCETLESVIFDQQVADRRGQAAAYLCGQAMAMSTLTAEAVGLAIENLLLSGNHVAANLALCIILGVERSSSLLFESHLPVLLRQVQMAAFGSEDKSVSQEALIRALKVYSPSEKAASCQMILQTTHALLAASLKLCEYDRKAEEGVIWTCFIIEHTPMQLRNDLRSRYPSTASPLPIFSLLLPLSIKCSPDAQLALCSALPILATWDMMNFVTTDLLRKTVQFMMDLPTDLRAGSMKGLGQIASVVLNRFEPFLDVVGGMALDVLTEGRAPKDQKAAQKLLTRLLACLGPITLNIMIGYLRQPHHILLADVSLLEMIATLLPTLTGKIISTLADIIDDLLSGKQCGYPTEAVLEALNVFPLDDRDLAARAQRLVLWSLEEDKGANVVIAALRLSTHPTIAIPFIMRNLTFKAAQLLLADDAGIVHVALSVLSNPALASMLDERSCSMILLALHQSLEPSIQIVAAKLLTHLTTAHRAIVQPLAWSHIRQSLSLMDFLHSVDPNRAIIEACIISNLLPALPPSLHKKYVGPVKELIMTGLRRPSENHTLSLIFQGLSNLAKFEGYTSTQQAQLAQELLEMTQEIPKDCQHAALNAISSLLSVPKDGLDVYELLINVHANFGGGKGGGLDGDLKALVSGIYGHLGTVERNPVISRDSKAAINRELLNYPSKVVHLSRISEVCDRYGPLSHTHINTLLTENLLNTLSTSQRSTDDRSLILETMTCLGILQPKSVPGLIPDLPELIMRELRYALNGRESARDSNSTSVSAGLLFLSSAVHTSAGWLDRYWMEMGEMMVECISAGEALPVLRGLDVVLDAIRD
ncbi:hypothetical protein CI109_102095 [Kwoniella shandongensis]|uniref:Uncharacterized protein n=1 Tax=Kwoniella shandongensis TaxID=1734106 RepID=A0A5M6BQU2_9TREE|nr:uncharacterized protein CI109_006497 [Kwoniella shandongensis]KAA5525127.1 hypothetical protein CI109_006497 [Kwoniella shandongensis]